MNSKNLQIYTSKATVRNKKKKQANKQDCAKSWAKHFAKRE